VPPDHPENYVMKAKQIVHDTPGAILANQFYNQVNPEAHYRTTGRKSGSRPVAGSRISSPEPARAAPSAAWGNTSRNGTRPSGSSPAIPAGSLYTGYHRTRTMGEGSPYKVEGIGGDKVPTTVWWDVIDEFRQVSDRESMQMARRLAREEGVLVGGSTGLNVVVALAVAREVNDPDACIVTVLCDTGERYLSKVFDDDWMQENQLLDAPA
jgi:cystathionine beta-synthase